MGKYPSSSSWPLPFLDDVAKKTHLGPIPRIPYWAFSKQTDPSRKRKGPIFTKSKWLGSSYFLKLEESHSGSFSVILHTYDFNIGALEPELRATGMGRAEADDMYYKVIDLWREQELT